jgi:hypothetical protein
MGKNKYIELFMGKWDKNFALSQYGIKSNQFRLDLERACGFSIIIKRLV